MKTILRGVILKDFLTFQTMVTKFCGIVCTIGSGMPLGKEGPLVHMSACITALYGRLIERMRGLENYESRKIDMLAVACSVGCATAFGAPVGGVLLSVEVTTSYYAVRNHYRGFFAAVCGALMYRLLNVWFDHTWTLTNVFKTNFFIDVPFDPIELVAFAIIGVFCGVGGAIWVFCQRKYLYFTKRNPIKWLNAKCPFIYPFFVVISISSITFPMGIGQYMGGHMGAGVQITTLFSNFTWMFTNLTREQEAIVSNWKTDRTDPFANMVIFMAFIFVASIVSSSMPIPCGTFSPVFRIGAAFGRIVGELMHCWYPKGVAFWGRHVPIVPGGYATVGAAAFTGSVTQTMSVAVIVFEMTGQLSHLLPILIATLIANGISCKLGISGYDNGIKVKKLPYLPDLLPNCCGMYNIYVEDFMVNDVKFIHFNMTYKQLQNLLRENKNLKYFPLVDNTDNMFLLGSVRRKELIWMVLNQLGREKRLQYLTLRSFSDKKKIDDDSSDDGQTNEEEESEDEYQRFPTDVETDSIYENVPYIDAIEKTPTTSTTPSETQSSTRGILIKHKEKSKFKKAFSSLFGTSKEEPMYESAIIEKNGDEWHWKIGSVPGTPSSVGKRVTWQKDLDYGWSLDDYRAFENHQLNTPIDLSTCQVDPAPFQLVERTSLLKVHSLFSLVGVNQAYVTALGRLVGVVGLDDLRKAIENANSGVLQPQHLMAENLRSQAPNLESNQIMENGTKEEKEKLNK